MCQLHEKPKKNRSEDFNDMLIKITSKKIYDIRGKDCNAAFFLLRLMYFHAT